MPIVSFDVIIVSGLLFCVHLCLVNVLRTFKRSILKSITLLASKFEASFSLK